MYLLKCVGLQQLIECLLFGVSDRIMSGESTVLVELNEIASILIYATAHFSGA